MHDGYHQKMVFMAFLNEGMNAPFSHTIHSLHTLHVEMQSSSFWRKCPRQLNSIKQKNRRVLINEIQIMMMWNPKLKSVQIDHDDNDAKSDLEKRRDLQQLMPIPTVLRPTVKNIVILSSLSPSPYRHHHHCHHHHHHHPLCSGQLSKYLNYNHQHHHQLLKYLNLTSFVENHFLFGKRLSSLSW